MLVFIGETFGDNKLEAMKLFKKEFNKEVDGLELSLTNPGNASSPKIMGSGLRQYDVFCKVTPKGLEKTLGHLKGKLPLIVK